MHLIGLLSRGIGRDLSVRGDRFQDLLLDLENLEIQEDHQIHIPNSDALPPILESPSIDSSFYSITHYR